VNDIVASLRRIGALFLLGFLGVICLALGIVYLQQTMRQKELSEQIAKLNTTLNQPMPGIEKLKTDYEEVLALVPLADPVVVLEKIVDVARSSGIDVAPESKKFSVPAQNTVQDVKVGDITYQVISFQNIRAEGDYENVMNFVSNLESGKTLGTAVVRAVNINMNTAKGGEVPEYVAVITLDVYTKRKG
jgi:hypothetical protein